VLTRDRLAEVMHYDPETGLFTWKSHCQRRLVGREAGGIRRMYENIFYRYIRIFRARYAAHRLAFLYMTGSMPAANVDHIDGNGLNNSFANLRLVTQHENLKNQRLRKDNTSGVCGVTWDASAQKWHAQIGVSGKSRSLGRFADFEQAVRARADAASQLGFHQNHGRRITSHQDQIKQREQV
jgi:hypothetical protein